MTRTWPEIFALLGPALVQTFQMVGIVFVISLVVGIPLAVIVHNTSPAGLFPRPTLHRVLSGIINVLRSVPFLILAAAAIPLSRLIMGTALGVAGAIVPLSLASIPLFARLVETALREVPPAVLNAGLASSGNRWQVIRRVQLPEALPGIVGTVTVATVGIVEFTAVAGAVGAGGLGYLALSYGYSRFDANMMLACVVVLVVIAQVIQFSGDRIARALAK
jgi:D-methionine transport system permease protein